LFAVRLKQLPIIPNFAGMENETPKSSNPFDRPEISSLFGVLMEKLLSESGPGAVLIGTSHRGPGG
jgi:hypothetical protein